MEGELELEADTALVAVPPPTAPPPPVDIDGPDEALASLDAEKDAI